MKKIILLFTTIVLFSSESRAEYVTPGSCSVITMESLNQIAGSGVEKVAVSGSDKAGSYLLSEDLKIAETDTLKVSDEWLYLAGDVTITVEGYGKITKACIDKQTSAESPRGLVVIGDEAGIEMSDTEVWYSGIRYGSPKHPLKLTRCKFNNVSNRLNNLGVVTIVTPVDGIEISGCEFRSCDVGALSNGVNVPIGLIFKDNILVDNNRLNTNSPQLNVTCAGDYDVEISNNRIEGNLEHNMVGGIALSNMGQLSHTGTVTVEGNEVFGNRYGITCYMDMELIIRNNKIYNNTAAVDPNSGGSGISIYYNACHTVIEDNYIADNLWGITPISYGAYYPCKNVDIGTIAPTGEFETVSHGLNTFSNNGNSGEIYDIYNNTAETVYAQNNIWVGAESELDVEQRVFHKADNASLGEVVYTPIYTSGVDDISATPDIISYDSRFSTLLLSEPRRVSVYSLEGHLVYDSEVAVTMVDVSHLAAGVYVARTGALSLKFAR